LQPLLQHLLRQPRWQRSRQHFGLQHDLASQQLGAAAQAGAALQAGAAQVLQPLQPLPHDRWRRALQHRGSRQHFLAHPQSAAAPHDFSQQLLQPQSIPSIRSRSSKPKLWLLRLTATRSAPTIMFHFIEQRLL
jgi:hypothetical protein